MKSIITIAFLTMMVLSCGSPKGNKNAKYACPMHPEITSDTMMKCPECGMDLEPQKKETHDSTKH